MSCIRLVSLFGFAGVGVRVGTGVASGVELGVGVIVGSSVGAGISNGISCSSGVVSGSSEKDTAYRIRDFETMSGTSKL